MRSRNRTGEDPGTRSRPAPDDYRSLGAMRQSQGAPLASDRLLGFVHPGRDSRARSGACSAYESDSAGLLAERHETGDRQAPSRLHGRRRRGTRVHAKAQLRADRRRRLDGLRRDALEIGRIAGRADARTEDALSLPHGFHERVAVPVRLNIGGANVYHVLYRRRTASTH